MTYDRIEETKKGAQSIVEDFNLYQLLIHLFFIYELIILIFDT